MNTSIKDIKHRLTKLAVLLALPLGGVGGGLFSSCADTWNDHYDDGGGAAASGSLWQAIKSDSQLSNFARVIEATGYDKILNSSQVFTVFAPNNEQFTQADADAWIQLYEANKGKKKDDDNDAIKEFVQNHIALYNYSASSLSNDSIIMMNGKYVLLTPNEFGGMTIDAKNSLYANGVLFKLKGRVPFNANVFEQLGRLPNTDSIGAFLNSYNVYEFDANSSVAGGLNEQGKTVYLDSVMRLKSEMFDYLGYINDEDSNYYMVVPTDEQWRQLVPEYEQYFNYASNVTKRDSMQYTNARRMLLAGTVFSRTFNSDASLQDSAMSTNAYRRYQYRQMVWGNPDLHYYQYGDKNNPRALFEGLESANASNGRVFWNPTAFPIDKHDTFMQQSFQEGESNNTLKEAQTGTKTPLASVGVETKNPFYNKLSGNSYAVIEATGTVNPDATLNLSGVLSNTPYDIYIVLAPAQAGDTLASERARLGTKFRCALTYRNENNEETLYPLPDGGRTLSNAKVFTSTPNKVDSILVGQRIVFPACTWGLSETQMTMRIQCRVSNTEVNNGTFNRTIRLDQIVLIPSKDE
jgi:hypothetical protein